MRSGRGHIVGIAVTLLLASPASAQGLDPRVEVLLREGITHRVAGRDDAAVERFERAYATQRAPVTAGQLALACQAMGRWVDADRYMREALSAPDDEWVRRHRHDLDEAYAVIVRHIGELELRGGPDGARVRVDGADVGQLPFAAPLRLRAGVATLAVQAEGYFSLTRQVTITPGELTREPLTLTAMPRQERAGGWAEAHPSVIAPTTPPELAIPRAPLPEPHSGIPVWTWLLGGAGAAFVAGGIVSVVVHETAAERFNTSPACRDPDTVPRASQTDACRAELITGDWSAVGAVVGFVGGAALIGASVALALLPRRTTPGAISWSCAPSFRAIGCAVTF